MHVAGHRQLCHNAILAQEGLSDTRQLLIMHSIENRRMISRIWIITSFMFAVLCVLLLRIGKADDYPGVKTSVATQVALGAAAPAAFARKTIGDFSTVTTNNIADEAIYFFLCLALWLWAGWWTIRTFRRARLELPGWSSFAASAVISSGLLFAYLTNNVRQPVFWSLTLAWAVFLGTTSVIALWKAKSL